MHGAAIDRDYRLEDRYTRERGRVYLTGVQALVRLPLDQQRRDAAAGLRTAGFISGYRGSPLGTYDLALWQARDPQHPPADEELLLHCRARLVGYKVPKSFERIAALPRSEAGKLNRSALVQERSAGGGAR